MNIYDEKEFTCAMEGNINLKCDTSVLPDAEGSMPIDFFNKHHFAIGWRFFDPNWENDIQAEEIFKRLILLYEFSPNDDNLLIVRGEKKISIPNYQYVMIPEGGIFVFDKTKIKVDYEETV